MRGVESNHSGKKRLILASASPRRRQLLAEAGYRFDVIASDVHEPSEAKEHLGPVGLAEALSFLKARCVAERFTRATVIGADTVVALGDCLYGKPVDAADARHILGALMHHPHQVITGVTLLDAPDGHREIAHAVTRVVMNPMPPAAFEAYLRSGLWAGKAGAYGVQDHGDEFVRSLDGSFSNVVGLPMELLEGMLRRWGYEPE